MSTLQRPTHYRVELTADEAQLLYSATFVAAAVGGAQTHARLFAVADKLKAHPYYADDERECCKYAAWRDVEAGHNQLVTEPGIPVEMTQDMIDDNVLPDDVLSQLLRHLANGGKEKTFRYQTHNPSLDGTPTIGEAYEDVQ